MTVRSHQMYRPLRTIKEAGFPGELQDEYLIRVLLL